MDHLKDFKLELTDNNDIIHSKDPNIPNIVSQHTLKLTLHSDYVAKNIDFNDKEGLKFYRIESITENPVLFKYIIDSMMKKVTGDVIVTADARGFIFASPVANRLDRTPLVIIRKKGKLSGPTDSESYQKAYGDVETIEMAIDSTKYLCGKNVTIIDDGIASGATTKAMYNLIKKRGGIVDKVIVAVKHNYCECIYNETPVEYVFNI